MNLVIAGAFGNLGRDLLRSALRSGHKVLAVDRVIREVDFVGFEAREADLCDPAAVRGLCDGADMVISAVGLTTKSKERTHYDIDLGANINLLDEAVRAGVKKFVYVSVIKAETRKDIPMLDAKHQFELALKSRGIPYLIFRPTGYFYDIAKVFKPMVEKGKVLLLKGVRSKANVVATADFADHIIANLHLAGITQEVGGRETYAYEEIAKMFFDAAGKPYCVSYVPPFLFDLIGLAAKLRNDGSYANVKFGKWTLENDMEAANKIGSLSFKDYIASQYAQGDRP
jgi:uncharacterized protein YbjT (DUF2867 family)